jgi:hypothetical protein
MCIKTVEINNIIITKSELLDQWVIGEIDADGISFKWKEYIPEETITEIQKESPYKKFFDRLRKALHVLDIEKLVVDVK